MDRQIVNQSFVTLKKYATSDRLKHMLSVDHESRKIVEALKVKHGVDANWDYMWDSQAHVDFTHALGEFLVPEKTSIGPFNFRFGKSTVFRQEDMGLIEQAIATRLIQKHDFWVGFLPLVETSCFGMIIAHNRARYRKYELERNSMQSDLFVLDNRAFIQFLADQIDHGRSVHLTFSDAANLDSTYAKFREYELTKSA